MAKVAKNGRKGKAIALLFCGFGHFFENGKRGQEQAKS
jgi:hypothetical protein